jgi:hypothetical protein
MGTLTDACARTFGVIPKPPDVLVNNHVCIIQEMYTVQDPEAQTPPSECLLVPSLHCLYKGHVRNQESPQPGESRPVMPPSRRVLSRQMTKTWGNLEYKYEQVQQYHWMLQQLASRAQEIIPATSVQDLSPRPCADNH